MGRIEIADLPNFYPPDMIRLVFFHVTCRTSSFFFFRKTGFSNARKPGHVQRAGFPGQVAASVAGPQRARP